MHHRRVLSPEIVRSLLPSRVATVSARAARADARAAAAQLEAVSAAYREASERVQESMDGLMRTDLDGLTWWVPLGSEVTGAARDRFVAKHAFHIATSLKPGNSRSVPSCSTSAPTQDECRFLA